MSYLGAYLGLRVADRKREIGCGNILRRKGWQFRQGIVEVGDKNRQLEKRLCKE